MLFHPMTTVMEQTQTIKEAKRGLIPKDLELKLPEIASIIKQMLAEYPSERPSLERVTQRLCLPLTLHVDLAGSLKLRKENSNSWDQKY